MEENMQQTSDPADNHQQDQEQPKQEDQNPSADAKDIEENRAISYLAYLGLLFLVPLLVKKDSKFAQFHAKQGLVLVVVSAVAWVIGIVPVLGWIIAPLIYIGIFVLIIIGLINVSKGEMKRLPIVGEWEKKFNI